MDGKIFALLIVAITTFGWLASSWIRARHGYPLEDEWGGKTHRGSVEAERRIELLTNENAGLKGQIGRLEERLAVLERIATDPATRTAHEIEQLRNS